MQVTINKYQCITSQVSFKIKPMTFIFGENGVGKSMVLQALWAAQDILCNSESETDIDIIINDKQLKIENNEVVKYEYVTGLRNTKFIPPTPLICKDIPDRLKFIKTYITPSVLHICNQTDAYLHPRQQLKLASLFMEATKNDNSSFLIETHSEYMLLRVLKQIRIGKYSTSDVNVMYMCNDGKLLQLGIDDDGDFTDAWPDGFFNDRANELFNDEEEE